MKKKIKQSGQSHSLEEFVTMLHSTFDVIADIRSFRSSRKLPQFNKEALEVSLPKNDIQYVHIKDPGGRRKANPDSKNTGWWHITFWSYADYMETDFFKHGVKELKTIALKEHGLQVLRGCVVALLSLHVFRLFKTARLKINAYNG